MLQRSSIFAREAGTVILLCTIGLWVLMTFPREQHLDTDFPAERQHVTAEAQADPAKDEAWLRAQLAAIDSAERGAHLRHSYAGRLGHAIEPAIQPLGYDWKIGIGLIGSFAAREVFVSTMAVVYGLDKDADQASTPLRERIREETRPDGTRRYDTPTVLSLMVFFALACQCLSTLAVARRESGHWGWPVFMFVYMTALAWCASFTVFQVGSLIG